MFILACCFVCPIAGSNKQKGKRAFENSFPGSQQEQFKES